MSATIGGAARRLSDAALAAVRDRAGLAIAIALYATCGVALQHAGVYRWVTIDDAFITYRYVHNLSTFHGFVYNLGERVEGTSAFLYALVLTVPALFGADIPAASRVLSEACFVGMVVSAYAMTRAIARGPGSRMAGLVAAWLVASSTPAAHFAPTGMETTFYALLLAIALIFHFAGRPRAMGIFAGLMSLARPEGAAFALLLLTLLLAFDLVALPRPVAVRRALRAGAAILVVVGPVLVFRELYFGELVPNSVIAKSGFGSTLRAIPLPHLARHLWKSDGARQAVGYLRYAAAPLLLGVPALLRPETRRAALTLVLVCGGAALVCVWNEGDWMGWHRLFVPTVVPVAVFASLGLQSVLFRRWQRVWDSNVPARVLTVAAAIGLTMQLRTFGDFEYRGTRNTEYFVKLGKSLARFRRDDDTFASTLAGVVPFYSGMRTIDEFGLCDRHIARFGARRPQMGKVDDVYVMGQKPTFYLFQGKKVFRRFYKIPAFEPQRDDYMVIVTPEYLSGISEQVLAARKDRPDLANVAADLGGELVTMRQHFDDLQNAERNAR